MENITLRVALKHNSLTAITSSMPSERGKVLNGKPQSNMFFTQRSFPLIENHSPAPSFVCFESFCLPQKIFFINGNKGNKYNDENNAVERSGLALI